MKVILHLIPVFLFFAGNALAQTGISFGVGSDPITNLARNAGSFLQSLCPLMAIVGAIAAIITKQLGNKDGLSWSIAAVVLGVLGMSVPAIINLVRSWTMF